VTRRRRSGGTSDAPAEDTGSPARDEAGREVQKAVLTFIDTPGAYPGLDSEERGVSEAIATNILEMARLKTPIIATVTGEEALGVR